MRRMSFAESDQAFEGELRNLSEYDHWKLQKGIDTVLNSNEDIWKRQWAQDLRVRVSAARNLKPMSLEQLDEHVAHLAENSRLAKENVQLEKDKLAGTGYSPYSEEWIDAHNDFSTRTEPKGKDRRAESHEARRQRL